MRSRSSQCSWTTFHRCLGWFITADALHTQAGHTRYLAEREAYHIFTVKVNQPTLLEQFYTVPWGRVPNGEKSSAKANGRQIIRIIKCAALSPGIRFPRALQTTEIARMSRLIGTKKWHLETVYAVASLPTYQVSPGQLAGWVRGHWGIEYRAALKETGRNFSR